MGTENPIFYSLKQIEEQILEKLTSELLADSIHFSKYHYQRMFREVVGESVMRYVTKRRLSLAAKELSQGTSSILEIALKYGYDSHEGFTRSFRAYMGVTPREYRKYHLSIHSPIEKKEKCVMQYSKITDEILRELNNLIVQAKETASYTRKHTISAQRPFWDSIAARTDDMAESLAHSLNRITTIPQQPDEISARFLVLKAVEDAAFWFHVIAFETGLKSSGMSSQERKDILPICEKYGSLAENANIKSQKIAKFLQELAISIFQDMRKHTVQRIQEIAEKTKTISRFLTNSAFPHTYITEAFTSLSHELSLVPPEEVTVCFLEDFLIRLDIITCSANQKTQSAPFQKQLQENITDLKKQINETILFLQDFPTDGEQTTKVSEELIYHKPDLRKRYQDMALQGKILLFYMEGEIQQLEHIFTQEHQKTSLDTLCSELNETLQFVAKSLEKAAPDELKENIQDICQRIQTEADGLGASGSSIQYLAKEFSHLIRHLSVN